MHHASELFWSASVEELKRGYVYLEREEEFVCLVCGESFEQGRIYADNGQYYEAERFMRRHIELEHRSMLTYLLGLDKKITGLSDLQKQLVQLFDQGWSDKEIMKEIGSNSTSIVRNHRFALREKMKQAKVFLAIMEQIEEKTARPQKFIHTHRTPEMVDERYAITEEEHENLLRVYFPNGLEGALAQFPKKQKHKLAILTHVARRFQANRTYSEQEVNEKLREIYPDYVTLRRYLIDYGFMERLPSGKEYWVKLSEEDRRTKP
ncbi:transcriptional regulator [Xylanibacillus composti]|uniref:Transcriptional regulator n=1 Tax=Xylanibacillus composti TaxID=1572762 RepID=A0A8J4H5I3_9BACL|nr:DUF2087 domain-containing protein [Xylanibacillus composti]GIQ71338.1 transcriptional regulator [Xylanibacillus composti]